MATTKKRKVIPVVELCNGLEKNEILGDMINCYSNEQDGVENSEVFHVTEKPYKVCSILNFLKYDVAIGLLNELQDTQYTFKENDLLSLHQTQDLKTSTQPFISAVRNFIYTDIKNIVEKATNSKFNSTIDLHGIKFMQHDNLLCHSDCLSSRHTAFILYLVPKTWSKDSGGALELYNCDSNDQPIAVETSLCPQFNSFSWFEVSSRSWHQVSEVLEDDIRWSISGWFHSDNVPLNVPVIFGENPTPTEPADVDMDILKSWISLKYLNLEISSEIQQQFQDDSEVSLAEFLLPEKYSAICEALDVTEWELLGPPNRRHFKQSSKHHNTVEQFLDLLKSDAFALLMSHCTGLSLSKNFDDPDCNTYTDDPFGMFSYSVTKWEKGYYSLLCDQEVANLPDRLHIFFHADLYPEYDVDVGGYVSFVSHADEEPLLVVPPQNNTLSLVFTRSDEFGFTKYINSKLEKPYYCINAQLVARSSHDDKDHTQKS